MESFGVTQESIIFVKKWKDTQEVFDGHCEMPPSTLMKRQKGPVIIKGQKKEREFGGEAGFQTKARTEYGRMDIVKIPEATAAVDGEATDTLPRDPRKTLKEGNLLQNHFFKLMKLGAFFLEWMSFYVHVSEDEKTCQDMKPLKSS